MKPNSLFFLKKIISTCSNDEDQHLNLQKDVIIQQLVLVLDKLISEVLKNFREIIVFKYKEGVRQEGNCLR